MCLSSRRPGRGITSVGLSRLWSAIEISESIFAAIELHHREKKFKAVFLFSLSFTGRTSGRETRREIRVE